MDGHPARRKGGVASADVERAVAAMRYPPEGERGFGPFVASSMHDFELTQAVAHYAANPPVCIVLDPAHELHLQEPALPWVPT